MHQSALALAIAALPHPRMKGYWIVEVQLADTVGLSRPQLIFRLHLDSPDPRDSPGRDKVYR
jgi:hypothetical protein